MDLSRRPAVPFPGYRQFAVTWSIPDDFGGMTGALLHRSRAFVRLAETPVDVLTFDARPDYPDVERELRERGELIDGMHLLNLWDWLRQNEVPEAPVDLIAHPFTPLEPDPALVSTWRGGNELSRARVEDGTVLQVDYFREDGSLLASDRRDARERGTLGGRSVVLCDREGRPVRAWGRVWTLYRFWIDQLRQRRPSVLIVDSKTCANFMATYRRKRAVVMHLVHNSHLAGDDPLGPLRESRREVFENLGAFDSVVLLTERQRDDVLRRPGEPDNLAVIPNGRAVPPRPRIDRPVGAGVVLASLTGRKRVDDAISAIARVRASGAPVTLDVYGDGPERAALEQLIETPAVRGAVRLHGYRADARERLAEASFLVLSATSEGSPLVLVEAMAAGCIPIAYDVPYGPADVIAHGRNGFLVPAGDVAGLAEAIATVQRMSPWAIRRMRRSALRSAARFSDLAITRLWAAEMRSADARKRAAQSVRLVS